MDKTYYMFSSRTDDTAVTTTSLARLEAMASSLPNGEVWNGCWEYAEFIRNEIVGTVYQGVFYPLMYTNEIMDFINGLEPRDGRLRTRGLNVARSNMAITRWCSSGAKRVFRKEYRKQMRKLSKLLIEEQFES